MLKDLFKIALIILYLFLSLLACSNKKENVISEKPPSTIEETQVKVEKEPTKPSENLIKNNPPIVESIIVNPKFPILGDTINIEVKTKDADGDIVSLDYQWFKNGEQLRESSNKLKITEDFKRGDKIILKVIPDDGRQKGKAGEATIVVGNSPPSIISSPSQINIKQRNFTYQVKASDPDGDKLVYSLKSAPSGMTINPNDGLIRWNVPENFKGKVSFTVIVSDGNGGEAIQDFTFEIKSY
jgi:hypothetical protein